MPIRLPAVFADGGCLQCNPSPHGGSYAWIRVAADDTIEAEESDIILPDTGPITNNYSELWALTSAVIFLPEGWSGMIYSDSQVSLGRLFKGWQLNGVDDRLRNLLKMALRHLTTLKFGYALLDGHPTKRELAAGMGHRGNLVSKYNVLCDYRCNQIALAYFREREASGHSEFVTEDISIDEGRRVAQWR